MSGPANARAWELVRRELDRIERKRQAWERAVLVAVAIGVTILALTFGGSL